MVRERKGRKPTNPLDLPDARFLGTAYSSEECAFLLEHLGEPSVVAMPPDDELPIGVNEDAVGPLLDRTYQLEQYQQAMRDRTGTEDLTVWCGFDKLRDVLSETLDWRAQVQELKRRTRGSSSEIQRAANAPSLHMWDPTTDIPYLGGIGADADIVQTGLNERGERVELFTELKNTGPGTLKSLAGVARFVRSRTRAEQTAKQLDIPEDLLYDEGEHYASVACPICKKSEPYEVSKATTKRKAVTAIMRHLIEENVSQVDKHRLLYQRMKSGKSGNQSKRVQAPSRSTEQETVEA